MKTLASLIALSALLTASVSWGCLPPPPGTPAIQIQSGRLVAILNSTVVQEEIKQHGPQTRIASIELENGTEIKLSNGCKFSVERDTSNASPGTCIELLPLKIVYKSSCLEQ